MMRTKLLLTFLVISTFICAQQADRLYPHYELTIELEPEDREITVKGSLTFNRTELPESLYFYLDKGMQIRNFSVNNKQGFDLDTTKSDIRYMPNAFRIHPHLNQTDTDAPIIEIKFEYQGILSELPLYFANVIGRDWTEIGNYYPWFPYCTQLKQFTYNLNINLDPEYKIAAIGKIIRKNAEWLIIRDTPTNDIIICASKNMQKSYAITHGNNISIYHFNLDKSILDKMHADFNHITNLYNNWFGQKPIDVCVVLSPRKSGGGYARLGGVVLGDFDPEVYLSNNEGYQRYFAHEFAHLWWYKAETNTWQDWLNEGLAEYSAMMMIRDIFGEASFTKRMDQKITSMKDTPPIWCLDRNNLSGKLSQEKITAALYDKGPVFLYELENKIGKKQFINFCSGLIKEEMTTTEEFLDLLKTQSGEGIAQWFEEKLKNE